MGLRRGWRGESYRHSLAAKGVSTYLQRKKPLYMYGEFRRAQEMEHSHWLDPKEESEKLDWEVPKEKESVGQFVHRSVDARENPGLEKWWRSVEFSAAHPWLDYDNEYARYLKAAGETPVKHDDFGVDDRIEHAAERGAAVVGRVVSQANVEPLIDHGKDGSARDIALDIFFGREDPDRELYPVKNYQSAKRYMIIKKLRGKNKWRLYSKDGKKNLGTFDTPEAARNHERQVEYFKHQNGSGRKGQRRYNSGLIDLAVGGAVIYGGYKLYEYEKNKKKRRKVKRGTQ